jgi:RimJ/RimL family protein N-acetyltransferase/predicted GNAT family acetyltransferase
MVQQVIHNGTTNKLFLLKRGIKMITTERLFLRQFTPQDEQAYADIMTNPNVYRYLGTGQAVARDAISRYIPAWNSTFGHGLGVYAVVEQSSKKLIGHCGVRGLPCGRREILYALDENAWGKGYASEAAKAVLKHHTIRPLIALSYPENTASVNVIKKLGFRHAGQEEMFGKTLESFILPKENTQLKIIDFTHDHIPDALTLTLAHYQEERYRVPILPKVDTIPDLAEFASNGFGVAAFDGGKMVGFLCAYKPFDNAFQSTNVRGIFSPMGGNASVAVNRAGIYAAMYQAAAEKWVSAGAVSHGICLYEHDTETQRQFYRYGFGLRCVDAIRPMVLIDCLPCAGYQFLELGAGDCETVYPLEMKLDAHQRTSPYFMNRPCASFDSFKDNYLNDSRYFGAKCGDELCAYLSVAKTGETFAAAGEDYRHICGAFCKPEHRGKGLYQNLLNFVITALKKEGVTRLGTDFESFNPAGAGFWLKYFSAYTQGVVRRIDERIL